MTTDGIVRPAYYRIPGGCLDLNDLCSHLEHEWPVGGHATMKDAMKYVMRAGRKSEDTYVEDLEKAQHCISRELARARAERMDASAEVTP